MPFVIHAIFRPLTRSRYAAALRADTSLMQRSQDIGTLVAAHPNSQVGPRPRHRRPPARPNNPGEHRGFADSLIRGMCISFATFPYRLCTVVCDTPNLRRPLFPDTPKGHRQARKNPADEHTHRRGLRRLYQRLARRDATTTPTPATRTATAPTPTHTPEAPVAASVSRRVWAGVKAGESPRAGSAEAGVTGT